MGLVEHLLTGEQAFLFRKELQFMHRARGIAGLPIAGPWAESLDEVVQNLWLSASAYGEGAYRTPTPDKI